MAKIIDATKSRTWCGNTWIFSSYY